MLDLSLLAALAHVIALVLSPEEQDHLVAIEVHKQPKQNVLGSARRILRRVAAEHLRNFVGVMAHPEFMESLAQGLQPLGTGEVDSPHGEDARWL